LRRISNATDLNTGGRLPIAALLLLCLLTAYLLPAGGATARKHRPKSEVVRVMTRNLYLGANLRPGLQAHSLGELTEFAGEVLRQVTRTDFPTRATGLAREILERKPDLVGLQEAALWRTAPPDLAPTFNNEPAATTVRYDFLRLLLKQLNKHGKTYKAVAVEPEFDFESPANENAQPGDGPNGAIPDSEINARLTMRDVILARIGAGVQTFKEKGGQFNNLLEVTVSGAKISVTRGWTQVDAKIRDSRRFRFVEAHLEAFDNETARPSIRAKQATELVAEGGPTDTPLPVILVGDLNSNDPGVKPGDEQAFQVVANAGFKRRSASAPPSCCIKGDDLVAGSLADLDHQVDFVLTNRPRKVRLKRAAVTGPKRIGALWDSDHAGLFSALRIKR
jgi:endonuclease/exonuclease/phosphatase family metal-dependent hydrolase